MIDLVILKKDNYQNVVETGKNIQALFFSNVAHRTTKITSSLCYVSSCSSMVRASDQ